MFCRHCGKQIDPESTFCPYCGGQIKETETPEVKPPLEPKEEKVKTYSSIFWKYFGILILVSIVVGILTETELGGLGLILSGVYTYFFCRMINEAMLSIGKKNWWPLGLLVLIPLGFWIVFFVVRGKLKPYSKWSVKGEGMSPFVIIAIVIVVIALIGILSSIVLVSLGGARVKARDARRMADIRMVATALELYYIDEGEKYPVTDSWTQLGILLSPYFANISAPFPTDPKNEYPCVYSYTSNGTEYIITYCSEENNNIKETTNYEYSP